MVSSLHVFELNLSIHSPSSWVTYVLFISSSLITQVESPHTSSWCVIHVLFILCCLIIQIKSTHSSSCVILVLFFLIFLIKQIKSTHCSSLYSLLPVRTRFLGSVLLVGCMFQHFTFSSFSYTFFVTCRLEPFGIKLITFLHPTWSPFTIVTLVQTLVLKSKSYKKTIDLKCYYQLKYLCCCTSVLYIIGGYSLH